MNELRLINLGDSTNWLDDEVNNWLTENATVVRRAENTPTLLLERDGVEFDRLSSRQPPKRVLQWLKEAANGRTWLEVLRFELRDEVAPRYELFNELMHHENFDEALIHFEWLWKNALAKVPHWAGVRSSYLLGAVEELYELHPPARALVTKLRDETERGHHDWVTLTLSLDDAHTLLDWLRTLTTEEALRLHVVTDDFLRDFIVEHDAYAELGRVISDASALLRERRSDFDRILASAPADIDRQMLDDTRENFAATIRDLAEVWARSLIAVERHDEAEALRSTARELEDT